MRILESYKNMAKSLLIEAEADKYAHIGYGKYKEKGKEDDEDADVYKKTDSGKFVKSSDQSDDGKDKDKEPDEPKGTKLGKGDFDRDSNKAGDDDADDMDRDARFAADAEVDGPSPEDDWDTGQVMSAKLDGEEVGDIMGDEDHPNYENALKYIMSFDPDDERLYTGSGEKQDEKIKVINGKKYKAIKESKKNPQIFKEIYDRTFRSLKWDN